MSASITLIVPDFHTLIFVSFILNNGSYSWRNNIGALKMQNIFCVPITFDNPLKVCFSNKKNTITTQTRPRQIVKFYFLLNYLFLTDF